VSPHDAVLRVGSVIALATILLPVQVATAHAQDDMPARLVVVLSVDQLRGDYLERFRPHFGDGGFERLLTQGAVFTQAVYEHAVTKTCPGHAVVLTGAHAADNGVISNEWWNPATGRVEYCAFDAAAPLIGMEGEGRSPRRLRVPTLGDVLKLADSRTRVISVAGKDRSAIMLGGHLADGVWWAKDTLFVTSRYYADTLPDWIRRFNAARAFTRYFGSAWDRLLAPSAYATLGIDEAQGERDKAGMGLAFPHIIGAGGPRPGPHFIEALEYSPFHDDIVLEFALEAMRAEKLGLDEAPDILAVGLSATDRVGHAFGPDSHEMLDMMIRTDRLLARLFDVLEQEIGLDHVLVVLTSDHGVAPLPETVQQHRAGTAATRISADSIESLVDRALVKRFGGSGWVSNADAPYIYLNHATAQGRGVDADEAARHARDVLRQQPWIHTALTHTEVTGQRAAGSRTPLALSFDPRRSGDVMFAQAPWTVIQGDADGTTHGSQWLYDRHVPLIFMGAGIRPGTHTGYASVADIASTLAEVLRIPPPPAASGRVLSEALIPRAASAQH
jgi:arylsulfatase A-like enzyme